MVEEGQGLHLKDYLNVVLRRKKLVLILFFAVFLGVNAHFLRQTPVYQAVTTLQSENDKSLIMDRPGYFENMWADERWMNTQLKNIKSRTLSENVVRNLGLQLQERTEKRAFEVILNRWLGGKKKEFRILPGKIEEKAATGKYTGVFGENPKFTLRDPDGSLLGTGEIGTPFQGEGFSFTLEGKGEPGKTFAFSIQPFNSVVAAHQGCVSVTPVRTSTHIIVTVRWGDGENARRIADATVEEYRKSIVAKKTRETSQVLAFIEEQLERTEKELLVAEENLKTFRMDSKLVDLNSELKTSMEKIAGVEKEYRSLTNLRQQAEIILTRLKTPGPFTEDQAVFSLGAGLNNDFLRDLGKRVLELNGEKAKLRIALREEHPRIQQVDREIENVKTTVTHEVSNLILSFRLKEKDLRESLQTFEKRYQHLPFLERRLFEMERLSKVNKGLNDFLLKKRAELSVNRAGIMANVSVVDKAAAPRDFVDPDIPRSLIWALVLAGVLGIGAAYFLEYLDTTVKTPDQLQRLTNLTFLGTVHHAQSSRDSDYGELKMLEAPYSHVAEAFRTIKTNLLFSALGESKKLFLVTSSAPQEGKTFVTANLATALAQSGKRVLIVETDLRNPSMRRIFGGEKTPGLTNYFMNGDTLQPNRVFRKTPVENMELIYAGDTPPNPSELLGSEKMDRFLTQVREKYDFVLFDSPPTFLASDSLVLSQKVDGVIFVARSGHVQREIVKESVDRFLRLKTKMLGVILNDLTRAAGGYYYYRYSYYYGSDGSRTRQRKRVRRVRTPEPTSRPAPLPHGGRKKIETNLHA